MRSHAKRPITPGSSTSDPAGDRGTEDATARLPLPNHDLGPGTSRSAEVTGLDVHRHRDSRPDALGASYGSFEGQHVAAVLRVERGGPERSERATGRARARPHR